MMTSANVCHHFKFFSMKQKILGPLLFTVLINDLPKQIKHCKVLLYADDTVIYCGDKSLKNIENCINSDADTISDWMKENCLILNPKKVRQNLSFTHPGNQISLCQRLK